MQGKVSLVTQNGIHQLHIFIFVLAVMQIVYSVLTMALGRAKVWYIYQWFRALIRQAIYMLYIHSRIQSSHLLIFLHSTSFAKKLWLPSTTQTTVFHRILVKFCFWFWFSIIDAEGRWGVGMLGKRKLRQQSTTSKMVWLKPCSLIFCCYYLIKHKVYLIRGKTKVAMQLTFVSWCPH